MELHNKGAMYEKQAIKVGQGVQPLVGYISTWGAAQRTDHRDWGLCRLVSIQGHLSVQNTRKLLKQGLDMVGRRIFQPKT